MTRKVSIYLILLLGAMKPCHPQIPLQTCQTLLPVMRRSHIPHLALAVFKGADVQSAYCSLDGSRLSPEAVFEAASLSKPVFAAAVLTLVNRGDLSLDLPLSHYLNTPYRHSQNPFNPVAPEDVVRDPRLNRVTARMVLSHTTGLPNWARQRPLVFATDPSREWRYSGEAYVYLQRVVETITGKPLEVFVQETVLEPLGMRSSSFVWEPQFASHALSGHNRDASASSMEHYSRAVASSTLYTTLSDYSRFVSALLERKAGTPYAMEEVMQVSVNPKFSLGWGLGVAIEESSGSVFHWGANPGFQSMFFVQPAKKRGILFLTDSDNGLDLVDLVVKKYLPGSHPALEFPMLHPKD